MPNPSSTTSGGVPAAALAGISDLTAPDRRVSIQVAGVSKSYQVWRDPAARLKHSVMKALGVLLPRSLQQRIQDRGKSYYREFHALQNISFTVRRGEVLGIVGRNGSGKSTLLQIIAGTVRPTSGEVRVAGRIAALLELGSGFNPEFTGRENVYLNGSILGLPVETIDARFAAIAAFADIGSFMDQPMKTYSTGMTVRVAFAVQSELSPDVLIVDEALAVGDEAFQRKCLARIECLRDTGTTILFVSHSAQDVIRFCDRAIMLQDGRAVYSGAPARVIALYQKFLYASAETQALILNNPDAALKMRDESAKAAQIKTVAPEEVGDEVLALEYFAPDLKSESEVRFDALGAEVVGFRVLSALDKPVNHLVRRRHYRIEVDLAFKQAFSSVAVGVMLTDKAGIEIAGGSSWESPDGLFSAATGERVRAIFSFQCLLNPGMYFLRIGVATREKGFIHRIIDAAALKVVDTSLGLATGYADCLFKLELQGMNYNEVG